MSLFELHISESLRERFPPNITNIKTSILEHVYRFQGDNPGAKQSIWDKVRCSWEHVGEHIENMKNMLGTPWELDWNTLGSWWEHIKNNKNYGHKVSPTLNSSSSFGNLRNIFYFLTVACRTCHKRQSNRRMTLLFCNIQGYVIATNCSKNPDTFQLVIRP
jgi:hypothetical protein